MDGPAILARTLTIARRDKYGNHWQYHPQSDRHSKVACWGVMFDLLQESALLRDHCQRNKVIANVNQKMGDYKRQRPKKLDLVVAQPGTLPVPGSIGKLTFKGLADYWDLALSTSERGRLAALPDVRIWSTGVVLIALECKATMTAHQRALPRLDDELSASHATVHGSSSSAVAAMLSIVNIAPDFRNPNTNQQLAGGTAVTVNSHHQPRDAQLVVDKVGTLHRAGHPGEYGYDAIGVLVVNLRNDGTLVAIHDSRPAPAADHDFNYAQLIRRMRSLYEARFANI